VARIQTFDTRLDIGGDLTFPAFAFSGNVVISLPIEYWYQGSLLPASGGSTLAIEITVKSHIIVTSQLVGLIG
jgi:hypothetical protein